MIAAVLLYVGGVLFLNGIWLIGQTQESSSLKISNKEIAVMNVFTGALGFLVAIYAIFLGGARAEADVQLVAFGGYVLLFAFTYLWVAINQYIGADGRALGWYSRFVAITALPTEAMVRSEAGGDPWLVWLGLNWLAWTVLWFLFFLLFALQWPIARLTGYVAVVQGIVTAWLLFQGYLEL